MKFKNYANFIRIIFGEKSVQLDEAFINTNQELAETIEEQLLELWDPFSLEYTAIDRFVLEGKERKDFAEYIRDNADQIADLYTGKALRTLRHPKQSGKLRPYLKFKDE